MLFIFRVVLLFSVNTGTLWFWLSSRSWRPILTIASGAHRCKRWLPGISASSAAKCCLVRYLPACGRAAWLWNLEVGYWLQPTFRHCSKSPTGCIWGCPLTPLTLPSVCTLINQPGGEEWFCWCNSYFFYARVGWSCQILLPCACLLKTFASFQLGFSFFPLMNSLYIMGESLLHVGNFFPLVCCFFSNILFWKFSNKIENHTENTHIPTTLILPITFYYPCIVLYLPTHLFLSLTFWCLSK